MSLYNLVCGVNPTADVFLAMLSLTKHDVPRYRDCYVEDGYIVIYTRTGGGNREAYEFENYALECHPQYSHDEDDSMDPTYANFYFTIPEEYTDDVRQLEELAASHAPAEKWQVVLDSLVIKD